MAVANKKSQYVFFNLKTFKLLEKKFSHFSAFHHRASKKLQINLFSGPQFFYLKWQKYEKENHFLEAILKSLVIANYKYFTKMENA